MTKTPVSSDDALSATILRAVETLDHAERTIASCWAAWMIGAIEGPALAGAFDCFAVIAEVLGGLAIEGTPHAAGEAIGLAGRKYQAAATLNARLYALDELDAPAGALALRDDAERLWDRWFPDFAEFHGIPSSPAPHIFPRGTPLELTR